MNPHWDWGGLHCIIIYLLSLSKIVTAVTLRDIETLGASLDTRLAVAEKPSVPSKMELSTIPISRLNIVWDGVKVSNC